MAYDVGYEFGSKQFILYNIEKFEINGVLTDPVKIEEADKYDSFFVQIKQRVNAELRNACFFALPSTSNNDRKALISSALSHGFKKVQIITDYLMKYYMNALFQGNYIPKNGDVIWVYHYQAGLSPHTFCWQRRNGKGRFKGMTKIDFKNREQLISQTTILRPTVICYDNVVPFFDEIQKICPACKFLPCENLNSSECLIFKTRIMAGEMLMLDYSLNIGSDYSIIMNRKNVMSYERERKLPLKVAENFQRNDEVTTAQIVKNYGTVASIEIPNFEKYFLIFTIDENGIYDMKCVDQYRSNTQTDNDFIDALYYEIQINRKEILTSVIPNEFTKYCFIPKTTDIFDEEINVVGFDFGTSTFTYANNKRGEILSKAVLPSLVIYDKFPVLCDDSGFYHGKNITKDLVFDLKRMLGKTPDDLQRDECWPFSVQDTEKNHTGIKIKREKRMVAEHLNPEEFVTSFAKIMDHDPILSAEVPEQEEVLSVEQIIADLVITLYKKDAIFSDKKHLDEVAISIPVTFNEKQKKAMCAAAKLTGCQVVHFIPEPMAAVLGYNFYYTLPKNVTLLVFNFGGGFFDVSIIKIGVEYAEMISSCGDPNLGGRDLDNVLVHYVINKLNKECNIEEQKCLLMLKCERIKKQLSQQSECLLQLRDFDDSRNDDLLITRKSFENLIKPFIERIDILIKKVMNNVNFNADQIDKILLVGGNSEIPIVKNMLIDTFPNAEHLLGYTPTNIVAMGAASYAYHLISMYPELRKPYIIPKAFTENDETKNYVGLDFGSSKCCAAVNRQNGMETVALDNTARSLSSFVGFDEERVKCGQVVLERLAYHNNATAFGAKEIIGKEIEEIAVDKDWAFKVDSKNDKIQLQFDADIGKFEKYAEEIPAILFKTVKERCEIFQGRKLDEVVISLPARFTNKQRNATYVAALLAGWKSIYFIPEPVAASFAYVVKHPELNNSVTLVVDVGSKSTDICILAFEDNQIQIKSQSSNPNLGGQNFDKVLVDFFEEELKNQYQINIDEKRQKFKMLKKCEEIKHHLSLHDETSLDVDAFNPAVDEFVTITRNKFEELCHEFVDKVREVTTSALHYIEYEKNKIDNVLYVGGGCRMPIITKQMNEMFPDAKHFIDRLPEEVIAVGAALYAYHMDTTTKPVIERRPIWKDPLEGKLEYQPASTSSASTSSASTSSFPYELFEMFLENPEMLESLICKFYHLLFSLTGYDFSFPMPNTIKSFYNYFLAPEIMENMQRKTVANMYPKNC